MAIYYDYNNPNDIATDIDAINNAIINILITRKGSVPGKPTFGSNLFKIIFSQIDHITKNLIKTYIIEAILEFEPRVKIISVEIKDIPEYNRVIAKVAYEYNIQGVVDTTTVTINLKD